MNLDLDAGSRCHGVAEVPAHETDATSPERERAFLTRLARSPVIAGRRPSQSRPSASGRKLQGRLRRRSSLHPRRGTSRRSRRRRARSAASCGCRLATARDSRGGSGLGAAATVDDPGRRSPTSTARPRDVLARKSDRPTSSPISGALASPALVPNRLPWARRSSRGHRPWAGFSITPALSNSRNRFDSRP